MSALPIVTFDDDVLRQEAKAVQKNSKELQQLKLKESLVMKLFR